MGLRRPALLANIRREDSTDWDASRTHSWQGGKKKRPHRRKLKVEASNSARQSPKHGTSGDLAVLMKWAFGEEVL